MALRNIWKHYLIIIILLGLYSCSKKNNEEINTGDGIKLIFQNVQILNNQIVNKNNLSAGIKSSMKAIASNDNQSRSQQGSGFNSESFSEQTSIEGSTSANHYMSPNITISNNAKNVASTSPMTNGYKYRILLYNLTTNQFAQTILAESGTPIEIEVPKGTKFKWYAYSYNDDQNIPEPTSLTNPSIETSINKDFIYASGNIETLTTPTGQMDSYPIDIVFRHKVAQVKVKIDGSQLNQSMSIQSFKASFERDDYLKKGVFSIKDSSMSNLTVVQTKELFNTVDPSLIWERTYYTSEPSSLTSYQVNIEDLAVDFKLVVPTNSQINLATFNPANPVKFIFDFASPVAGEQLASIANLTYTLSSRRILHVSSTAGYGYSLQLGPGWEMINSLQNFGNLPNSIVRMQPYTTGQGAWIGGTAANDLTNFVAANNSTNILAKLCPTDPNLRPDIVIFGYNQAYMDATLQDSLVSFVNQGGVFIMMNEFVTADVPSFLNKLFDVNTIAVRALGNSGSMYPIVGTDSTDRVLNGPFGDVRGQHWGEDASTSVGATGLPAADVIIYSYGEPINRAPNVADANTISMFKHKTKNFFYLGDGGLVSYNGGTSATICPFDFDPITRKPKPKPYGNAGNGYLARSKDAYNGTIAGNVMLWAGEIAEFDGLRKWRYAP